MTPLEALIQVFYLIFITLMLVLSVEAILYWLLYKYNSKFFWIVGICIFLTISCFFYNIFSKNYQIFLWIFFFGVLCLIFAKYLLKGKYKIPILLLTPAFLLISLLIIYPFFFEIRLAFADLNLYTINEWIENGALGWVGFENFKNVFTISPLQTATFWKLLFRTFMWTFINVFFHVVVGMCLALLLNQNIKFKGIYRTILILPWAIPQVIAVLAWRGEFHPQFGVVNQMLKFVGIEAINWWSDPWAVFASCCIVNIWLGIPFMMVVFLGGLQAIPKSYYEAASIDGASKWNQFWNITLPMLRPVIVPSITLGTIWTFNNINVIFLMTGQAGGNEFADILVSALYKSAFTYSRYSYSAAFALVIFVILIVITTIWIKITKGTESVIN